MRWACWWKKQTINLQYNEEDLIRCVGYKMGAPNSVVGQICGVNIFVALHFKQSISDFASLLVVKTCFVPVLLGLATDDDFIRPHYSDRIFEVYMVIQIQCLRLRTYAVFSFCSPSDHWYLLIDAFLMGHFIYREIRTLSNLREITTLYILNFTLIP